MKRRNGNQTALWIGAAVVGAVGLYALTRSSGSGGGVSMQPAPAAPAARPDLLTRLRTSQLARQVFNVQALAWSMGLSREVPDGIFGPRTQTMVNSAETAINTPLSNGFTPYSLFSVRHAGERGTSSLRLILLPMYLPTDVVRLLNREALAIDPMAILIQARAATNSSPLPPPPPSAPPSQIIPPVNAPMTSRDVDIMLRGISSFKTMPRADQIAVVSRITIPSNLTSDDEKIAWVRYRVDRIIAQGKASLTGKTPADVAALLRMRQEAASVNRSLITLGVVMSIIGANPLPILLTLTQANIYNATNPYTADSRY